VVKIQNKNVLAKHIITNFGSIAAHKQTLVFNIKKRSPPKTHPAAAILRYTSLQGCCSTSFPDCTAARMRATEARFAAVSCKLVVHSALQISLFAE
jgi:hypothetical protein